MLGMSQSVLIRKLGALVQRVFSGFLSALKQFEQKFCENLLINYRNVIFQNLYKAMGLLGEGDDLVLHEKVSENGLQILIFLENEIQYSVTELFSTSKSFNLKTLLNICVCLYEYMGQGHWAVVLSCFARFLDSADRVRSQDLEDFALMKNSIQSLFLASRDFPCEVIFDFLSDIESLLLGEDQKKRRKLSKRKDNKRKSLCLNIMDPHNTYI